MRIPPVRALLVVAALAVLGPVAVGALGCELLVQLDPALVDAGDQDGLAVEEETVEAGGMPDSSSSDAGADAADSPPETSSDSAGETSLADSSDAGLADSSDAAGEASTTESGAD
jgi:hypothetical protein